MVEALNVSHTSLQCNQVLLWMLQRDPSLFVSRHLALVFSVLVATIITHVATINNITVTRDICGRVTHGVRCFVTESSQSSILVALFAVIPDGTRSRTYIQI